MKLARDQRISLGVVGLVNLVLWAIPSDVIEQIARDRQTLMGRYSRTHFAWIVGVFIASVVAAYLITSKGEKYKQRWFRVIATLLVIVPTLGVADWLLRSPESEHYIRHGVLYHRPPNSTFEVAIDDKPEAYRTYPNAPPGYGHVDCTLHTDRRGYRNVTDLDRYDAVVLGDSFAEGSRVSDEQPWPRLLATLTGKTVYNLGMSGYAPVHYRTALSEIGLSLNPKLVLCLLYEGNDFRSAAKQAREATPGFSKRLKTYFKQSPILDALDAAIISAFGPINAHGPVRGAEVLSWLPLTVPRGPRGRRYAFPPKQLRDLYKTHDQFAHSGKWAGARYQLDGMKEACDRAGCRFVVVYAPTVAHVMLPLVADVLDVEKLRAFAALDHHKPLPPPAEFSRNLAARLDARESVVRAWCHEKAVRFVSLVEPLRAAAAAGKQVYYTYDQHWTPDGHAVVAGALRAVVDDTVDSADPQTAAP